MPLVSGLHGHYNGIVLSLPLHFGVEKYKTSSSPLLMDLDIACILCEEPKSRTDSAGLSQWSPKLSAGQDVLGPAMLPI